MKAGMKIALIGSDSTNPVVHGGGSGSVAPTYIVSPYDAISIRNTGKIPPSFPKQAPSGPVNCTILDKDTDYFITNGGSKNLGGGYNSPAACCAGCGAAGSEWLYFTHTQDNSCWCHVGVGKKETVGKQGYTSGSCRAGTPPAPGPSPSSSVTTYTGDDPTAAATAAAAADVAVVFVSTTSSEGSDRKTLAFSDDQNAMVAAVAKAQKKTIVVMVNPGAVLTPWTGDVAACMTMFMPGLEMGNSLSDILYGDVNPSGRLPLTFPNVDNEQQFTQSQWPGLPVKTGLESTYTEKLNVGYRWYDAHQVTPKFAFGHGLSYASFAYSDLTVTGLTISFTVKNTGTVAGAEIPQLYIGFPSSAGEPPKVLRGFEKVMLQAGGEETVTFALDSGMLSVWDVTEHGWAPVSGTFQVYVGASSRDIKLTGTLAHANSAKTVPAWV